MMLACWLFGHDPVKVQGPGTCKKCHEVYCSRCFDRIGCDLCTHALKLERPEPVDTTFRRGAYR